MVVGLLNQTCTVYRPAESTVVFGRPVGEGQTLSAAHTDVKCRLDFTYLFGSRMERATEEFAERTSGVLFVKQDVIRPRDIIVMDDPAYHSDQYEVEFIQPTVGFGKVSHFEIVVKKRDNPYTIS